jgi:16S rRNA (cytidine1402-2'-O)-methyltransferase
VGTLYVTGPTVGEPEAFTFRMQRTLREVALVVAADTRAVRRVLSECGTSTSLAPVSPAAPITSVLETGDAALFLEDGLSCPSDSELALIQAAIELGHSVVPLPGASLPIAALVVSGMPADSFVYLGELPRLPTERRRLLAEIAGEHRTLLATVSTPALSELWADLIDTLGNRPLTLSTTSDKGLDEVWRGTVLAAMEHEGDLPQRDRCILVIGGGREAAVRWDEERLRNGIRTCLSQGLGVKESSRRLAAQSGWPRREVYDLTVEISRFSDQG